METTSKPKSNPIFVIAAIAITIFSAIGIGAMTGLIPSSFSKNDASKAVATSAAGPSAAKPVETPVMASVDTAKLSPEPKADAALSKAEDKVLQPVAPETKAAAPKPAAPKVAAPKPAPKPAAPKTVVADNSYVGQPYTAPVQVAAAAAAAPAPAPVVCTNCGVVEAINAIQQQGDASGVGAVIGGVAGGVVGHQVGSGRGRDLATVLGAVGGAVAGNQVEKAKKAVTAYDVVVRLNDNTQRTIRATTAPDYGVGQKVKIVDGQIVRN
ncbi:MAG: glycine zipper 2TM domain-containing protein [Burkholderiales bacterium]